MHADLKYGSDMSCVYILYVCYTDALLAAVRSETTLQFCACRREVVFSFVLIWIVDGQQEENANLSGCVSYSYTPEFRVTD